jgi:uncharacterized protein YjdB
MVCVVVGWLGLVGCGDDNNPGTGNNNNPTLTSLSLSPPTAPVAIDATTQLMATGSFSDGTTKDLTTTVTWSSSAAATATVNTTGLVTGVAVGNATITATATTGQSATATINVTGAAGRTVTTIAITPDAPSLTAGNTQQLTAIATFSDQSTDDVTDQVTWSTDTAATATVDAAGVVTAVAAGTATITATLDATSGSTVVTVNAKGPHKLLSLVVTPENPTLAAGATLQLVATGTFADGTTAVLGIADGLIWRPEDSNIALISESGLVSAKAAGETQLIASTFVSGENVTNSTKLTVTATTPILASIAVTPAAPTAPLGKTAQVTATGTFNIGPTQDLTKTATWASDNTDVATVDANGVVTAHTLGTANISASQDGITSPAVVFTATAAVIASITVTPAGLTLPGGVTQQYTATEVFSDGTTQDVTATAKWASNNASRVTISNKAATIGLATTISAGQVAITATFGGISGSTSLTVSAPQVLLTDPTDGETDVTPGHIAITFDQPVAKASLVTQLADGPCSGTLQLSKDDFVTCVGFAGQPSIGGNIAIAGLPGLLEDSTTYKIQITSYTSASGTAGTPFKQANGFTTAAP